MATPQAQPRLDMAHSAVDIEAMIVETRLRRDTAWQSGEGSEAAAQNARLSQLYQMKLAHADNLAAGTV